MFRFLPGICCDNSIAALLAMAIRRAGESCAVWNPVWGHMIMVWRLFIIALTRPFLRAFAMAVVGV
jgi:hypothetical protein